MELLKRAAAPELPVKILQFGEGNFLRAFIDWMVHCMNKQGLFNGLVQLVQPLNAGTGELINAQGGLYTLILRGVAEGKTVESREIIESVAGCINPYADWAETVAAAVNPDLRFVVSNTTEAGIEYQPEEYCPGRVQKTFPAKLVSLTYERYKAFDGAPEKRLIFIPCELIEYNGKKLRECMLKYADDWQLPEGYKQWLSGSIFMSTLVDRIVAGYPRQEAEAICQQLGYQDNLLDCGEPFHFFVLEGPQSILDELPLKQCGLNVCVTDNMVPYRTRKVRFLNGAHTANVLAAAMGGMTYVDEMMKDEDFGKMVRDSIYNEIFPTVALPDEEKKFFAASVVERFLNPFANHRLLSIALNSVSKWKVRVLPSLLDYVQSEGKLPPVLAFSLAALLRFYRVDDAGQGTCQGVTWKVDDSPEVVAFFKAAAKQPLSAYVSQVLSNRSFWERDLTEIPGLAEYVCRQLELIEGEGIRAAVKAIIA